MKKLLVLLLLIGCGGSSSGFGVIITDATNPGYPTPSTPATFDTEVVNADTFTYSAWIMFQHAVYPRKALWCMERDSDTHIHSHTWDGQVPYVDLGGVVCPLPIQPQSAFTDFTFAAGDWACRCVIPTAGEGYFVWNETSGIASVYIWNGSDAYFQYYPTSTEAISFRTPAFDLDFNYLGLVVSAGGGFGASGIAGVSVFFQPYGDAEPTFFVALADNGSIVFDEMPAGE